MTINLSEIQITGVILMSFITLVFVFIVPHYTKNVKILVVSRIFIMIASALSSLHFILQYLLQKEFINLGITRMLINLIFGFPIIYLFTMALMYLVRRGNIRRSEWLFMPITYAISLIVLGLCIVLNIPLSVSLYVISFIYFISLLHCSWMEIRGFIDIKRQQKKGDKSYDLTCTWTQWSLLLMPAVALISPIAIFFSNVTILYIYVIFSIAIAFICVLGIMGYILSYKVLSDIAEKEELDNIKIDNTIEEEKEKADFIIDDIRLERINKATQQFINEHKFATQGITIKDAAVEMKLPVSLLRTWLRTTEHEKFTTWLLALRVEYAKELLSANPILSDTYIAKECGFCNRQYFQNIFSKYEGLTPSKWVKCDVTNNVDDVEQCNTTNGQ